MMLDCMTCKWTVALVRKPYDVLEYLREACEGPLLPRGRLVRRKWPQRLKPDEPAPEGRQDDRHETDHGGIDQEAHTAYHLGLEKLVPDHKQGMSQESGGDCHAYDLAAVWSANRAGIDDPDGQRNKQEGSAP